jgi:hypothetical protein
MSNETPIAQREFWHLSYRRGMLVMRQARLAQLRRGLDDLVRLSASDDPEKARRDLDEFVELHVAKAHQVELERIQLEIVELIFAVRHEGETFFAFNPADIAAAMDSTVEPMTFGALAV